MSPDIPGPFALLRTGLSQALRAPRLILFLWAVQLVVALPAAVVLGHALQESMGASLVQDRLVEGFDTDWWGEWEARAQGLETTFGPRVAGVEAFLDNLDAWWSGRLASHPPAVVGPAVLFALLWAFLLGGVLQWLARPAGFEGSVPSRHFFSEAGRFFGRFLRLAVFSGVLYLGIYALARGLFGALEGWTRDVTAERTVLLWVLLVAALVVALLVLVRVIFDLAKVLTVVDDRRGMLVTLFHAARLVLRRPLAPLGLYALVALLWLLLVALYALVAPVAGPAGWPGILLAFLLAQVLLMARLGLRLGLLAGDMTLYQRWVGFDRRSAARAQIS